MTLAKGIGIKFRLEFSRGSVEGTDPPQSPRGTVRRDREKSMEDQCQKNEKDRSPGS